MTSDAYAWRFTGDPKEFLERTGAFLRSEPALHTVLLTVTDRLRKEGVAAYGEEPPYFGRLADGDGTARAALLRTPPYALQLTALTADAADALAVRLAEDGRPLPSASGPADAAAAFAAAWGRRTGADVRLTQRQRLYRLGTLTPPASAPPGTARGAAPEDRDLITRWFTSFCEDIGDPAPRHPEHWVESRLGQGGITLWETPEGTPVSMAAAAPEVAGQIRVTTVYTPAPLRGRGYAGAATAAASRAALDSGAAEVLLFTDLANPTSNGLYQRLGYRAVTDFAMYEFGDPAPTGG
ncbi:GNAT family N-acetyltransferase [Streptomyces sp. SID2888]|uniref:GNAT family N-acetyltransferase n=2 Tax=Streptomyces sp. SID2888 TaxID=2690256 RepID=UPI00136DF1C1|nr:GNAT family N-acetyltransferase [Streptomyces sp. SID2888]MYV47550.1 GNAT family N-acetyltransferase [Streptomyces sp. SID2888]